MAHKCHNIAFIFLSMCLKFESDCTIMVLHSNIAKMVQSKVTGQCLCQSTAFFFIQKSLGVSFQGILQENGQQSPILLLHAK